MSRDQAVSEFGNRRESRNALISPKRPSSSVSKRAKDRPGAAVNASVSLDELDGLIEASARDFREALGDGRILEWEIVNAIARYALPTGDPIAAEVAIAIENQQWFGWRRIDPDYVHEACLRPMTASVEADSINFVESGPQNCGGASGRRFGFSPDGIEWRRSDGHW